MPYKIAVLCYLYDGEGHLLLLHRDQQPNLGRYSPVGGKVDVESGEGPHQCAVREIREETGVALGDDDLRLTGIVSERSYQDEAHWLIFLFEVVAPLARDALKWTRFNEGTLEWKRIDEVADLPIPRTDRQVMWPLVQAHRGGF
ncbi:MAG: NUDIX hydrolase, partial [Planctomycetota bacterium]